jgi:hypothetical protein
VANPAEGCEVVAHSSPQPGRRKGIVERGGVGLEFGLLFWNADGIASPQMKRISFSLVHIRDRAFLQGGALLLAGGLLLLPARANLGETVAQSVARYGSPTSYAEASAKMPFGSVVFKAGPYELVIFILNDKEVGARVSKGDKSAFSDSEMQTIMGAETGGDWVPTPSSDPTTLQWSRSDHATVLYDKTKRVLILTSPAMAEALKAPSQTAP